MINKKWMSLILSVALMLSVTACADNGNSENKDKSEVTTEATETTTEKIVPVEKVVEIEIDISKSTEEAGSEEAELGETISEDLLYNVLMNRDLDLLRAKATEVYEQNPDALFGYSTRGGFYGWTNSLIVLSGDSFTIYEYDDEAGAVIEDSESTIESGFMLPYDVFMEFPCIFNSYYIPNDSQYTYSTSTVDDVLADGKYFGMFIGFSENCDYVYATLGRVPNLNLSAQECIELGAGDEVVIDGQSYNVLLNEPIENNCNLITLEDPNQPGDTDAPGCLRINITTNGRGVVCECRVMDSWGYTIYDSDPIFVRVPISDSATINLLDYDKEELVTDMSKTEVEDFLNSLLDGDERAVIYDNGGISFKSYTYVGIDCENWTVQDGQIVDMTVGF